MIEKILLFINLSLLILHEMDAVHCKEWKLFVFLKNLSDSKGRIIFSILHLPFFLIIFFLIEYQFEIIFWILNIFLIFHLLIHLLTTKQKFNNFKCKYSYLLIISMGLIGASSILIKLYN
jgi:TctA family transporter